MAEKIKRIRRTAEEARRIILDAASQRLAALGPEGIRLQDIAKDVGISHPTILHHFESREGLVLALTQRATEQLRAELFAAFAGRQARDTDMHPILDRVFDVLSRQGHARLIGWMILSGAIRQSPEQGLLRDLTDLIHPMRVEESKARGMPAPERDDTLFIVMLGAVAAFGDGLFGPMVRRAAGVSDEALTAERFRAWFAELLRSRILPAAQ
ncbi:MAG TPA: TetR/AcrR family transcriptional regulator [Alphaproteobacteria bacterium]|nr:TetR/AcrR family transcriptional regulator [Alphaproteobacteria bacterium]